MNEPVDTIRIMEEVERVLLNDGFVATPAELKIARKAVAHLIDKVEELLSTHGEYRCYGGSGESIEEHMRADLVFALARVKGESA